MKEREYGDYIQDILEAIEDAEYFIKAINYDEFKQDRKTVNAVVRSLEIIGEASKNIPKEMRLSYSEIPWKRMAGMRDKLIHEYFGVDLSMVWEVVKHDLPPIKPIIHKILTDLDR